MSIDMMWQTESISSEQTEQIAEQVGSNLRGGETIELVSDLGGGKTTFTRGLVRGAGSRDRVASPTFTISRQYQTPRFTIYHFDFYRLSEAGIVAHELAETVDDPQAVSVVEWGEVVGGVLPKNRLTVNFTLTGEDSRRLQFTGSPELDYLIKGLK